MTHLKKISFGISLLLVTSLAFAGCKKEEKNDDTQNTLVLLAAALNNPGDCAVTAGTRTTNTFTTDLTTASSAKSGVITQVGTVPIVGHQTSVLKITAKVGTTVAVTGKAFGIVYKSENCPLTTAVAQTVTTFTYAGNATDSSSQFTNSHEINGTSTLTFAQAGTHYYFFYAIPSRGQAATVTYAVTNL
ncbi:LIC20153 family lipoprotein [Leptospira idonii]|uniref:Lipoprotein n=1 Tax=Leptospira idonii TaxID=1193500 RepID=A0A4R9M3H3_9LEPT|nr:hypothetical protein [Leptospira idonii]TGN20277.1 hypothetical protein EHS15_03395 [Leptospira idonii]